MSGEKYKIEIFDARDPDRVHRTLTFEDSSKLVKQLRADFEGIGAGN